MYKVVLVRHGQSEWNRQNRFTGWVDVDLSERGLSEAQEAGRLLKKEGYTFDICYTSLLKRAIKTLNIILDEMDLLWLPCIKTWHLNERHYGALQGLNKAETAKKHGDEQVHIWRRSYDIAPPRLSETDKLSSTKDRRYKDLEEIPHTENLKLTVERVLPYWHHNIVPKIKDGKRILISAHGNSLRALVKHLNKISDSEIVNLNIPTGVPLVFELNEDLSTKSSYYLGEEDEIKAAQDGLSKQGRK